MDLICINFLWFFIARFQILLFQYFFTFPIFFQLWPGSHPKRSCWSWQWYFSWIRRLFSWVLWGSHYSRRNNSVSGIWESHKRDEAEWEDLTWDGLEWGFRWWLELTKLIWDGRYFWNRRRLNFPWAFVWERRREYWVRISFEEDRWCNVLRHWVGRKGKGRFFGWERTLYSWELWACSKLKQEHHHLMLWCLMRVLSKSRRAPKLPSWPVNRLQAQGKIG